MPHRASSPHSYSLRRLCRDTSGAILVSGLMIMAALMILGIAAMQGTTIEHTISGNHLTATQAFYAAEAGVTRVVAKLIRSTDEFVAKPDAKALGLPSAKPAQANFTNNFSYWVSDLRYDPAAPPTWVEIEGSGNVLGTKGLSQVVARVEFDTAAYLFDRGIFADQSVAIGGTGDVDSYNSCEGPYDPDNPGTNATVGTNGTGEDSITLQPQATISGDAYIGPEGDPTTDISGGTITGTSYALEDPKPLYPITDPGGGESLTLLMDGSGDINADVTGGTYRLSDLTLDGGDTIHIKGDVTIIVDGPITIAGRAQIIVNEGARLKLYMNSTVDLGGNSIVNLTNYPKNNLLFGTDTATDIFVHGTPQFHGAIYAPTATVTGVGTSDFFGGIIAKNIATTGTAGIHQDECLGVGQGGGTRNLFKVASWRTW